MDVDENDSAFDDGVISNEDDDAEDPDELGPVLGDEADDEEK